MWRTFVCGIALLGACSEPERVPAPPTAQETSPTAPAVDQPEIAPDDEEQPPTEAAPSPSEAPAPAVSEGPPEGDIPSCTWYADSREPTTEGPRSLAGLDRALTGTLGEETWVLGRVRGRARDCPDVSVGLAIVGEREANEDPDLPIHIVYGDPPPHIVGDRGDERRTLPWDPTGDYVQSDGTCTPPDNAARLLLFRATHADDGSIEHLRTMELGAGRCRWLRHFLQLTDIDHDGRSEVRVETRSASVLGEVDLMDHEHRLRIVDVSTFETELDVSLQSVYAREMGTFESSQTDAAISFADRNGDGHRDAVLRGHGEGTDAMIAEMDPSSDGEFVHNFTHIHYYDPAADRFVRAEDRP